MSKYFKGLKLGQHNAADLERIFQVSIEGNKLLFSLKWTPNRQLLLYKLHIRTSGEPWINKLKNTIPDTDGELCVELGKFAKGGKVEVAFGIMASTDLPKCIAIIAETHPARAKQAAPMPVGTTKALKATETWEATFKYTMQ